MITLYISTPQVASEARSVTKTERRPAMTPGMPWRLFTPHVSCRRSFS